ncbi:TRAP transporter substrate-binding protein [Jiangella asiatica]|uniref:TRAP transporter substrate-binding protein n=1 Tax=Jiangella asiatica TaxID=2530372 RepID=A0A4R5DQE6_9ACTN|nr:TRAP transporter substrate-binding protein [Jiangella asiatica]TDE15877.1 TRAP transporter substrate-binding protein [Jiangella asiatica]
MTSFSRSRTACAVTAGVLMLSAACTSTSGDAGSGGSHELILGATSAGGSLEVQALQRWADAVAERSDDRLTVTILADGQLGSELETQEAIINGDVHGVSGGVTGVPELDFLAAAYIFRDADHMLEVMRSDVAEPWSEAWVEQSGVEIVGVLERLPRTLTSNVRVEEPGDADGLDVRVPNTEFQIDIWEAVGATPVGIPSQEVYSALETGVVDAQENALDTAYANAVGDVQQYVTLTEHTYMPQFVGVSVAFLESLPDDLQEILRDEMRAAEEWLSAELDTAYTDILEEWESQGLEIIEPDVDAFRELMYPVTEQYAADIWGDGVLDRIQSEF